MTRLLYALAWLLATPFVVLRLAWRARRQPGYLYRVSERFGRYGTAAPARRIWIHAVSVGETRAAAPLVEALLARFPDHRILVTHMTPTGRATGESLWGERVERAWLPYDLAFATRRFFRHWHPEVGVLLETEIWPRLIEQGARAKVPVLLANARLSERSARRYRRARSLSAWAFDNLAGVAAQTAADARRLESIGASSVSVLGNVKFDLAVPPESITLATAFRAKFGAHRIVWLAASTRDGEEALLLDAFAAMPVDPRVLLAVVPRHPDRFEAVAAAAAQRGLATARRSDTAPVPGATRVLIGDSMGEMLGYYGAADVAILGGSLLPYGGQNLIEACAMGCPVIVGPHTYNFEEAADGAIGSGAALRVATAAEALEAAAAIGADAARREAMGEKARAFVAAHRGAVERLADWIAATAAARR
jgi:3-deoxy-D-manno-octulosonic-acid transferase